MKVRGDLAPASAFTIEQIPNQFGKVLVRFFENPHPYKSGDISGFEYDEYHLEMLDTGSIEQDVENTLDVLLEQAKQQELYDSAHTPEAFQAQEQRIEKLTTQAIQQLPVIAAAKAFAKTSKDLPDETALQMKVLFPTWEEALAAGTALIANTCITKDGVLYRVVQNVTPQAHQAPDMEGMLAIYRPIDETHAGTKEDPIPWRYGMDCLAGQYYTYENKLYRVQTGGNMIPCVWAPDSGIWQWEEVE